MARQEQINEIQTKIKLSLATLEMISKGEKVSGDDLRKSVEALKDANSLVQQLNGGYFA